MADLILKEFEFRGKNGNSYKGLSFPGYGTGETSKPATSNFLDLAGKSNYASRYDHSHRTSQIVEYGDDHLFVNKTNKTKLYELKTQAEIDTQIAESVLNVKYQPAVNYYSQLPTNAEDGWLVPVLYDEGNHPAGDYRYHKESPDHQTGVATGWYLQSTNKVPLASETLNGLLSSSFYSYIKGLKDSGLTGLSTSSTLSGTSSKAAREDHQHNISEISNFPTSLKNPYQLILKLNSGSTEGTNLFTYDGSAKKEFNITASAIGAATTTDISNALKSYLPLSGGTMNVGARIGWGASGNLFIGNSDNHGWLQVQDICSQLGNNKWSIRQDGKAMFDNVLVGNTEDCGFFMRSNGARISCGKSNAHDFNVGSLLVSDTWLDETKVPSTGIWCKGNIYGAHFLCENDIGTYWITGRNTAVLRTTFKSLSNNSWYPILSMATNNYSVELGTSSNHVYLSFASDSNFNAGINSTIKFDFNPNDKTLNADGVYFTKTNTAYTWTAYQDFTAGAGNSGSDIRFKELLGDSIGNVLSDVKKINIFPYIWRKENETNWDTFGVNADLMLSTKNPIFHKMVHKRDDADKTKFVDYDRFGLIAIKAIQEITEIYEMKMKNLFDRIEKLESTIRNK